MYIITYTPRKINMEPENTSLEKEQLSSKPSFSGSMIIFAGCIGICTTILAVGALYIAQNLDENVTGFLGVHPPTQLC